MDKCIGLVDDLSFVMLFDSDNVIHPVPAVRNVGDDLHEVFRILGLTVDVFDCAWKTIKDSDCKLAIQGSSEGGDV